MMHYETAPLYDFDTALQQAQKAAPQILAERISKNPKVMQQRLTAYLLLAKLCGGTLPPMQWSESGKPLFSEDTRFCSLSHTDTGAAAVICNRPVGIDLQTIRSCSDRLAERVCTDTELFLIQKAESLTERDLCFTRIWSAKEAASKVHGEGLTALGFKNIAVSPDTGAAMVNGKRFSLFYPSTILPDTIFCIAAEE